MVACSLANSEMTETFAKICAGCHCDFNGIFSSVSSNITICMNFYTIPLVSISRFAVFKNLKHSQVPTVAQQVNDSALSLCWCAGLIFGPAQWVKDPALPQLWHRLQAAAQIQSLTWKLLYAASAAKKNKQTKIPNIGLSKIFKINISKIDMFASKYNSQKYTDC